ncbi:hypothetical protein J6590_102600, partial [Homalodisca vitripennis]
MRSGKRKRAMPGEVARLEVNLPPLTISDPLGSGTPSRASPEPVTPQLKKGPSSAEQVHSKEQLWQEDRQNRKKRLRGSSCRLLCNGKAEERGQEEDASGCSPHSTNHWEVVCGPAKGHPFKDQARGLGGGSQGYSSDPHRRSSGGARVEDHRQIRVQLGFEDGHWRKRH